MSEYTHLVIPKKLYEADTTPIGYGVHEWEVVGINYYDGIIQEYTIKTKTFKTSIRANEIGDSFFLAYEEAEAALKEGETMGQHKRNPTVFEYKHPLKYAGILDYDSAQNRAKLMVEENCLKCENFMGQEHDFSDCNFKEPCFAGFKFPSILNSKDFIKLKTNQRKNDG